MNKKSRPDNSPRAGRGARVRRTIAALILLGLALANLIFASMTSRRNPQWWRRYVLHQPPGIILHHTATPQALNGKQVDAEFIDRMHARRGFNGITPGHNYHIGYHYLILGDGTVERGRPEWMPGAHTRGHNDQLGICLVGDFSSWDNPKGSKGPLRPTAAQLKSLDRLLKRLIAKYGYTSANLHRHRDYAETACPGDRFPFPQVVRKAFAQ